MSNKIALRFYSYVVPNMMGMAVLSAYCLADTLFVSWAAGAMGLAALNLVLPIYYLIFCVAALVGIGSATRFKILFSQDNSACQGYLTNALMWSFMVGLPVAVYGALFPESAMRMLGANQELIDTGTEYTRIFMSFTPVFMWSYIVNAFVRNDENPNLAMAAILSSSIFNIVGDYILMFPLGMGMPGAALATAMSPIVNLCICSLHWQRRSCNLQIKKMLPSVELLLSASALGTAAAVTELSNGVIIAVFNLLFLELAGNMGVAAYGIIANFSIVGLAMFNGLAQGAQPLFSEYYGRGKQFILRQVLMLGMITSLVIAAVMVAVMNVYSAEIIEIFNEEGNRELAELAAEGILLYFPGFFFAGLNLVGISYLSSTEVAKWASALSFTRGCAAITPLAIAAAFIFGTEGVWLSFAGAELITLIALIYVIKR